MSQQAQHAHTMTKQQLVEHIERGLKITGTKFKVQPSTKQGHARLVEQLTWLRCRYRMQKRLALLRA